MKTHQYPRFLWATAFVLAFVVLDWASYIDPLHRLNITPWNPAPALAVLFLLNGGFGGVVTVFVGILIADTTVRGGGGATIMAADLLLAAGYNVVAWALRRYLPPAGMFEDRKGLLLWSVIVVCGSFCNSVVFVGMLRLGEVLPAGGLGDACLRFWVGDAVGIFVGLPLFWWLQDKPRRLQFLGRVFNWETVAYLSLILAVLWVAFGFGAAASFRYFYLLFLPLAWAASRQGMGGAVFSASALQLGMIVAGQLQSSSEITIFELQMRAMVLALVGFLIGTAVEEQRRAAAELRQSLRLVAAGETAAAIAHELNQPLTALSAYGVACEKMVQIGESQTALLSVIRKMVDEARRAAEVVRRLREFFHSGTTRLERFRVADMVDSVASGFADRAIATGVDFRVVGMADAELNADRLQVEIVLRNLLANALDAVADVSAGQRRVVLEVRSEPEGRISFSVKDSGPGVGSGASDRLFEPFVSTKSSGLGLGLAISRAIAEAHGGTLTCDWGDQGCFRLTLPAGTSKEHADG